jgi:tRNA nucleotidyltransferase/poly(A) polymerase
VELEKIIIEKRPLPCLRLLIDWGILQQVHPGIRWDSGLPEDSAVPAEVYESNLSIWLSLILRENSVEEVGQTLIMLKFPSRVYDRVMQCQELYAAFKSRSPVITLPRTAVFPESKSFFGMLVRSNLPGLKEWWSDFLRWLACEPSLSGEDLKSMGYAPGPLFKEILQHLALKKFSGEVVSREDEARFVIDNFRRE